MTILILFCMPFIFNQIGYSVFAMANSMSSDLFFLKTYLMNCVDEPVHSSHSPPFHLIVPPNKRGSTASLVGEKFSKFLHVKTDVEDCV
jgi:hypothetical protein